MAAGGGAPGYEERAALWSAWLCARGPELTCATGLPRTAWRKGLDNINSSGCTELVSLLHLRE